MSTSEFASNLHRMPMLYRCRWTRHRHSSRIDNESDISGCPVFIGLLLVMRMSYRGPDASDVDIGIRLESSSYASVESMQTNLTSTFEEDRQRIYIRMPSLRRIPIWYNNYQSDARVRRMSTSVDSTSIKHRFDSTLLVTTYTLKMKDLLGVSWHRNDIGSLSVMQCHD